LHTFGCYFNEPTPNVFGPISSLEVLNVVVELTALLANEVALLPALLVYPQSVDSVDTQALPAIAGVAGQSILEVAVVEGPSLAEPDPVVLAGQVRAGGPERIGKELLLVSGVLEEEVAQAALVLLGRNAHQRVPVGGTGGLGLEPVHLGEGAYGKPAVAQAEGREGGYLGFVGGVVSRCRGCGRQLRFRRGPSQAEE